MHDIIGYSGVKVKTVNFKKGNTAILLWCYGTSSEGNTFSIKLAPHPPNGKSCQFAFGDPPASCEDLELSTTSHFGVSNTMRTNLLNWCHLVSISKNVVFYAFLVVRIY